MFANALKKVELGKEITNQMKLKFPNGSWKGSDAIAALNTLEDLDKRKEALDKIVAEYPAKDDRSKNQYSWAYQSIVQSYIKSAKVFNMEKFLQYCSPLSKEDKLSLFNNTAC